MKSDWRWYFCWGSVLHVDLLAYVTFPPLTFSSGAFKEGRWLNLQSLI